MNKYSTFWPRFWAGLADGLILSPLNFLDTYLSLPDRGTFLLVSWAIFSSMSYFIYSIALHARYGQTLGKRWAGVRVVNLAEDRLPSVRQAAMREIGDLIFTTLGLADTLYLIFTHNYSVEARTASFLLTFAGYGGLGWFLIELITMFTNKKRRALHDFIAGTVVIRTGHYSLKEGLGLAPSLPPQNAE